MPITGTPQNAFDQYVQSKVEAAINTVLYNLCYVGEQVVNEAKSTNTYKDQTNNLRSSLGYVVVRDGQIFNLQKFTKSGVGTEGDGSEGVQTGTAYATQLAASYPRGIYLIVVAGMKYAIHVSNKGYNVLESAELLAEKLVPKMLADLGITQK